MLRFLLVLLGLVMAGVYAWRTLLRLASGAGRERTRPPAKERMVPCARCGLYIPESEALAQGALHYCSEEHRLAGPGEEGR
jgi:uncharacterized protein